MEQKTGIRNDFVSNTNSFLKSIQGGINKFRRFNAVERLCYDSQNSVPPSVTGLFLFSVPMLVATHDSERQSIHKVSHLQKKYRLLLAGCEEQAINKKVRHTFFVLAELYEDFPPRRSANESTRYLTEND